jgi:hypothetical protein
MRLPKFLILAAAVAMLAAPAQGRQAAEASEAVQASESAFFSRFYTAPATVTPAFTKAQVFFTRAVTTFAFVDQLVVDTPAFSEFNRGFFNFHRFQSGRRRYFGTWAFFSFTRSGFTFHEATFKFSRTLQAFFVRTFHPQFVFVPAVSFFNRYTPPKTMDCPSDCGGTSTCTEGDISEAKYTCNCADGWYKTATHNTKCIERPLGWEVTAGDSACSVKTYSNGVQCIQDTHGTYDNNQACSFRYTAGAGGGKPFAVPFEES